MRYLMFTYIDLKFPDVKGLKFEFDLQSEYPTDKPTFYGSCDNDAVLSVEGVIREISMLEFDQDRLKELHDRKKVPEEVTAAQAKSALYDFNIYAQVEQLVKAYPYPRVTIWWNSATVWRRNNPYVSALAIEMNLSEDTIDNLFIAAAKIKE